MFGNYVSVQLWQYSYIVTWCLDLDTKCFKNYFKNNIFWWNILPNLSPSISGTKCDRDKPIIVIQMILHDSIKYSYCITLIFNQFTNFFVATSIHVSLHFGCAFSVHLIFPYYISVGSRRNILAPLWTIINYGRHRGKYLGRAYLIILTPCHTRGCHFFYPSMIFTHPL